MRAFAEAYRVVSELGEHPGSGDLPDAGHGEVDLSVRVREEMRLHLLFHPGDLLVERGDQPCVSGHGGRVGRRDRVGQRELPLAQSGLDGGRLRLAVASAVAGQDGRDLRAGQLRRSGRSGGFDQQFQGVGTGQGEVGVDGQGGGEVLAQRAAQPLKGAGAFPYQRLVGTGV
ncbi:hypothetical protein [Streptomyces sp. NPDC003393]